MEVENPKWWAAQVTTALRPVTSGFACALLARGKPETALILFTLGATTDMLDGPFARLLKVESEAGKRFDQLADASLIGPLLAFHALEYPCRL